jgi:hypothetical protein
MMRERLFWAVLIGLLAAAGLAGPATAGNVNWQSAVTQEGDWLAPANWSGLAIPAAADSAYIDGGATALIGSGNATARYVYVGSATTGAIRQSGGSQVIHGDAYLFGGETFYDGGELHLGYLAGAGGTYELGGTGALSAVAEYVGYQGGGTFRQTAGTNTLTSWLCLGAMPAATGLYEMSGDAQLTAVSEQIGLYGGGTFTQNGGVNTVTTTLFVGSMSGVACSYTLAGGRIAASNTYVGFGGIATFTHSGGKQTVTNELVVGYQTGSTGTYRLSDAGAILSVGLEYVGYQGTGTFIQEAGAHTVTGKLSLSDQPGGSGAFTLSGGTLTTGSMNNNGAFTQTGGQANVGNVDGTGTMLIAGDGGPALTAKRIRQKTLTLGTAAAPQSAASLTAGDVTVDVFTLNAGTATVTTLAGSGSQKTALVDVGTTLTARAGATGLTTLTVNGSVVASDGAPAPAYQPVAAATIAVAGTGTLTAGATAANHFTLNGEATVTSLTGTGTGSQAEIPEGKTLTANGLVSKWSTLQVNGELSGAGSVSIGAGALVGTGFINGPVTLTGDATLSSTDTLTITSTLTVQGLANQLSSGTLVTTGDVTISPGAVFIINGTLGGGTGDLIVRGTLMGKGTINKSCVIEAGGVLSPGAPSTIQGMSQMVVGGGPQNFSFEIAAAAPNYATPSNSLNDLVRLTSAAAPFADAAGGAAALTADTVIDVYFLWSDPALGEYKAEFFAAKDFSDAVAGATYEYWRLDPRGSRYHNGNFYSSLDASLVDWSVVPETATFDGAPASGYITQFSVVPEPATLALVVAGAVAAMLRRKR